MANPSEPASAQEQTPRESPADAPVRTPVRIGARKSTTERNNSKTIIAALAVHIIVGFVVIHLVNLGHGFYDWFGLMPAYEKVDEHLVFVEPPKPKPVVPPKPVARPTPSSVVQTPRPSTGPIVGVPTPALPPVTQSAVDSGGGGDNSSTGTQRRSGINPALVGITPANADPRVWAPGALGINVPRSAQQLMDSVVAYAITSAADSLDSIARLYEPGKPAADWTKRLKNGEKWGWDQTGLRLGKVTVPNALLALLPAGLQQRMSGNPLAMASARSLALSRADIDRFSRMSMNEADFRKEVKELRAKKEREHTQQAKAKAAQKAADGGTPPPG